MQSCHPQSLALAGAHSSQKTSERTSIELAWTGLSSGVIPLRRTEQVMMEMIREVKSELVIVSFAVYDNSAIVPEMEKAVTNSVALTVVVETLNPARERLPLVRYDFHRFDQNKYLYP